MGLSVLTFIIMLSTGFLVTHIVVMSCDATGVTTLAQRLALLLTSMWMRFTSTSLKLCVALLLAVA